MNRMIKRAAFITLAFITNICYAKDLKPYKIIADGITYEYIISSQNNKEVSLVKWSKTEKLVVPEMVTIEGIKYKVTSISCYTGSFIQNTHKELKEVVLPNTIEEIGYYAFGHIIGGPHMNLEKINLPEGLKSIGKYAFYKCTKLKNIYLPSTLEAIGEEAFAGCSSLDPVKVPLSVTTVGNNAFADCKNPVIDYYDEQTHKKQQQDLAIQQEIQRQQEIQQHFLSQMQQQTAQIKQSPIEYKEVDYKSDIDDNIPRTNIVNKQAFAIIICNENYQHEKSVDFAIRDGKTMKQYLHDVLGLPEKNIHFVENATLNNMIYQLDWLKTVCEVFGGDASAIVYYAGHGVPDEQSRSAYLLPVDGLGTNTKTGLPLTYLYALLGALPCKKVLLWIDACFSGAQRSGDILSAARGVAIKVNSNQPQGKMVVMTAAQGDETAYSYQQKKHGLFTYFLLKKLQETAGNVALGELADYISKQVSQFSIIENSKKQTPSIKASSNLGESWRDIYLR